MSRKILNDVRFILQRKGYINTHRIINEDLARPDSKFPRTSSRFQKMHSRKEYKNNLIKVSNRNNVPQL